MLSLVVIAQDEADRIAACLQSVPIATERIVVDSGSSDGTRAVARACAARVVRRDWPGHVAQKNRALELATQPWILSLDADERLTAGACRALAEALGSPGDAAGFSLPRRNHWLGRRLGHGRWYPDRKVRVVARGRGRWCGDDPHDRLEVEGPVVALRGDIEHHPYRDLAEHLDTIDRYSRIHAETLHRRGVRGRSRDVWLRPPAHLVKALVLDRGVLDGPAGIAVAGLGAIHVWRKWSRLRALRDTL